jgi:porphobilinogen deaminase
MAEKVIRIGTRDSELALANPVRKKLNDLGIKPKF